jgi:hypothetical protein
LSLIKDHLFSGLAIRPLPVIFQWYSSDGVNNANHSMDLPFYCHHINSNMWISFESIYLSFKMTNFLSSWTGLKGGHVI